MNWLFKQQSMLYKFQWRAAADHHFSWKGASMHAIHDIRQEENRKRNLFQDELEERRTVCPLDRALLRAKNSHNQGQITLPEYYRIKDKVHSLKKLKFVEAYEQEQDPEIVEWMKYKVAAQVGGQKEMIAFQMYEKQLYDRKSEMEQRLFRDRLVENVAVAKLLN